MAKKKKQDMMDLTKETVGVGVGVMAGHGVLGAMSGLPGMPAQAQGAARVAGTGLNLIGVGQMAKVGMGLGNMMASGVENMKPKKSKSKDKDDWLKGRLY